MPRFHRDMQPLQGVLHNGGESVAASVVVTADADRIVVRGDDEIQGARIKRLRCEAADASRVAMLRTDRADWQLLVHDVAPNSWIRAIKPPLRVPVGRLAVAAGLLVAIAAGSWAGRERIIVAAAPLIPHKLTDEIGRAYLAQMGGACDAGPGAPRCYG